MSKPSPKKKEERPLTPRQMCDAYGEEAVLDDIRCGKMLGQIAREIGVSRGTLTNWINSDPDRSACAREARRESAAVYDEMALEDIEAATDQFSLAKAKEKGHHLRWRASKINPRDYGDKVQAELSGPNGGPIKSEFTINFVSSKK